MNTWGELRALVGGTTAMVGTPPQPCVLGLVRNLDSSSGLRLPFVPDSLFVRNLVFLPERPDVAGSFVTRSYTDLLLVHVAEGIDDASRNELERLRSGGGLGPKTAIVHGIALAPEDLDVVAESGAAIVWSPRSNLELYGHTADIGGALERELRVALAPDWGLTGSAHLLDELRFAREWSREHLDAPLEPQRLLEMATLTPAAVAGLSDQIGAIRPGLRADLVVLRGDPHRPWLSAVEADSADVELVIVAGEPLYGTPHLMRRFWPRSELVTIEIAGESRALRLPGFGALRNRLREALADYGLEPAPLAEAVAEPPK